MRKPGLTKMRPGNFMPFRFWSYPIQADDKGREDMSQPETQIRNICNQTERAY